MKNTTPAAKLPAESMMPFYHHVEAERRPAVRWVKVSWLGSLLGRHMAQAVREAAKEALVAIDDDDPRRLVVYLRAIAAYAGSQETRALASGAADAVERAI